MHRKVLQIGYEPERDCLTWDNWDIHCGQSLANISEMTMPVNKRNWRKQEQHLRLARGQLAILREMGETMQGRPVGSGTAQSRVKEWRQHHPEGRKADCHRDTGLDPKTLRKWWDI